jgi:phospholipid/cholesterol/gamma-HCH transport system ATP-binding protein
VRANNRAPVLEFVNATIQPESHQMVQVENVSFAICPCETVVVYVEEGREHLPLADAAEGLVEIDQGQVRFCGQTWSALSATRQSEMRGRIRRVFESYGWISNLDVMENICLGEAHHTRRSMDEIVAEANELARKLGLAGVPDRRPARVWGTTLRKLEWVRAFMGRPTLIVLERPLFGATRADLPYVVQGVRAAAEAGAAVLWIASEAEAFNGAELGNTRSFAMRGRELVPVQGGQA